MAERIKKVDPTISAVRAPSDRRGSSAAMSVSGKTEREGLAAGLHRAQRECAATLSLLETLHAASPVGTARNSRST